MKEQGNDLSKRIRFLRVRKGMTQEQLASAMGLKNRDSISKIELGKQDISTQQISLLADIFDVSISYLLFGQIDKEEITLEDMELLKAYYRAPPHIQRAIKEMLKSD
jgi:transcriptional regulator with XRE-family HTH domain|nr:MAG TPA: helix-turn-helix domain protein [Caudoviricetes sp.]